MPAERPNEALAALADSRFSQVAWVAETGSTNADLLARARAGAPDGEVLVADHQSAGRGRLGRAWQAPAGASLLVSALLRRPLSLPSVHLLTVALGLAAVEAVHEVAAVDVALKWPNDVVVPDSQVGAGPVDRKLGGILAESVVAEGELQAVVVGMGLNVRWPLELPAELREIAVALNHLTDVEVARPDLLVAVLRAFERHLASLESEVGAAEVRRLHLERCRTIGRHVRVELAAGAIEGEAVDITEEGHLVVSTDEGLRSVAAGDVVHLR